MSKHTLSLLLMPNEMLSEICARLYPEDIKMLRLVNRYMHDVSSPYLMKRAFYAVRPVTHAVFQEIYNHPIFSKSITEIVYDASQFTREHVKDDRPECEEKHRSCAQKSPHHSREDREVAAFEYTKLWKFQKSMISSGESWRVVTEGFGKFEKLNSVFYTDWSTIAGDCNAWYSSKGPLSWDIKSACFPDTLSRLFRPHTYYKTTFAASQPLFGALLVRPALIKHFIAYTEGSGYLPIEALLGVLPLPWDSDQSDPPSKKWHLEQSRYASNLETFVVEFEIEIERILIVDRTGDLAVFKDLLSQMSNLRSLMLNMKFYNEIIDWDDLDEFNAKAFFIKDLHWPKLKRLELLGNWRVDPDDMLQLLRNHGKTLRHLVLTNVALIASSHRSWIEIFEAMPSTIPHLQSCSLSKLLELDEPPNHLNYLPEHKGCLGGPSDCNLRRKQLDCLQRLALGQCLWGDGPDDLQRMLVWLKESWHDFEAMDRGSQTWAELDVAQALSDPTRDPPPPEVLTISDVPAPNDSNE